MIGIARILFRTVGQFQRTAQRETKSADLLATRWSTRVLLAPDAGELRDQNCTTYGPKVNCVIQVDF